MEAEISQAVVKFERDYMGRGPTDTRTHLLRDMVIVRLKGIGGVAALRDSVYPCRYGHIVIPARDRASANLMRKMALSVWVREDDPTPLSLAAGYANRYQGALLTKEEQDRLRSNTTRRAVTEHKRKGAQQGQIVKLMAWAAFAGVIITGLTWLSVPLIALLK